MQETVQGIVLNTIRYSDRHNIVHVYTDRHGLMAFAVPQGATRSARQRAAMLMPLSLIECVVSTRPARELASLRDLRRTYPLMSIYSDPVKNAIALFVSEVLTHVIQEQESNPPLYRYIEQAVMLLEQLSDNVANFHICFLYHLGAFLGIEPDVGSYRSGYWFDMNDGVFRPGPVPGHRHLRPEQARVIALLARITFSNMGHFRFSRQQRDQVLDTTLTYFQLHNSSLGTLRSPQVLKQLFV